MKRRPGADDSVRNDWHNAARVDSSGVVGKELQKKGFKIPVVAAFVDPPSPLPPKI